MSFSDFFYGLFIWFARAAFNFIAGLFMFAGTMVAAYTDYLLGFILYTIGILMKLGMEAHDLAGLLKRPEIKKGRLYFGALFSILLTAVLGYGFALWLLSSQQNFGRNPLTALYFTKRAVEVFALTSIFYTTLEIALALARVFAVKFYWKPK